jgi:ribosomal protein S18 acetylase RimI-like enzyme
VSDAMEIDGWRLERAADDDIDELMTWFDSKRSVEIWGTPKFRYPFNKESFVEDSHWYDMATFSLRSPDNEFSAFGQIYERNKRINLARLIAHPQMRGQGVGKRLTQMLMSVGENIFPLDEYSLFVYRDNTPALECYRSVGFEIQDYPSDQILVDECYYLTRLVAGQN